MRRSLSILLGILLLATSCALMRGGRDARAASSGSAGSTWDDPERVEIRGSSSVGGVPEFGISGPNPERFRFFRQGESFSYLISHLPSSPNGRYDMELSFAEPITSCPGSNVFDARYSGGEFNPLVTLASSLNICTSGASLGSVRALSIRIVAITSLAREVVVDLAAVSGHATLSFVRIGPQGSLDDGTASQLPVSARRNEQGAYNGNGVSVGRLTDFSELDVHEVPLSRFGTRALVSPAPQRLGWRQSPLGIGAADLGEFVVLVRRAGVAKALPFTDRFELFDSVSQSDRATGVLFKASDPALGINVDLNIAAPFWPQDESATAIPAFYAELTATNPAGYPITDTEIAVALPASFDSRDSGACAQCAPRLLGDGDITGVVWSSQVATGDSARPSPGENHSSITVRGEEAIVLASSEAADVSVEGAVGGDGTADSSWLGAAPLEGAGIGFREPFLFERRVRGHSGFTWRPAWIPPGGSASKSFILAMHAPGKVFRVTPPGAPGDGGDYGFSYASRYPDLTSVAESALALREDQLAKSAIFDGIFAGASHIDLTDTADASALRELTAIGLRSYALNAWMLEKIPATGSGPDHFFNIWEGTSPCCAFNSTVDVVYNDAQLLLALWPGLLDQLLEQWKSFATGTGSSTVMPHDIGLRQVADGQFYYAMPVEENANYILLSYAHWKSTGDAGSAAARLAISKNLLAYIAATDLDGDSLPDVGTTNTFDASNETMHTSRNQIYLGIKAASAAQAVLEEMAALGDTDPGATETAERIRHGVAHTLENAAWRGDHFAVSLDPAVGLESDRNARSINAANGLMYLLQFGGNLPISPSLMDKLRTDATSALIATLGPSGSVQMDMNVMSGWMSQSIWRDSVSTYLGARPSSGQGDFVEFARRYRDQQVSYARQGDGGWWDAYEYDGAPGNWNIKANGLGRGVLGFYPRGADMFGLLQAAGGVSIDRHHGVLGLLGPARASQRVPLFALADWSTGKIPVADVTPDGATVSSPTPASAALAVMSRAAGAPSVSAPETIAPSSWVVSAEITASGVAGDVSISAGHSGTWHFEQVASSGGEASSTWDGMTGGQPAYNAAGSACVMDRTPAPTSLRLAGCAPLSVNDNTPEPSKQWYLAEGSTAHGFSTYVLIQNPGDTPANVVLTYMTPAGPQVQPSVDVAPRSRKTITVADSLPGQDHSTFVDSDVPVVAERSMYWRDSSGAFREGHVARGALQPRRDWYLPEGSTNHGFAEFILLQNPSPTVSADVAVVFDAEDGRQESITVTVPPQSRRTVNAGDVIPLADVATRVASTEPVVVERAMYWGGIASGGGTGGAGLAQASRTWFLAEGSSGHGFSTYTLLQNPSGGQVAVNITYNTASGSVARRGITMPPYSRRTVTLADDLPGTDSSIFIQASAPVLAERSMYWSAGATGTSGWTAGHVADGTPGPSHRWNLAEGTTDHGFTEYVLLQNPSGTDASVTLSMQPPGGAPLAPFSLVVPAGTRRTVRVNDLTLTPTDLSIAVDSSVPVIAERAMYTGAFVAATGGMAVR
ncbi:MAG: hypothetical protein DCC49_12700 [Acidobacteria bacterium]|nr:MAG: hypothetical protein DCC49_12700 [Acidobacteriota bacterium]